MATPTPLPFFPVAPLDYDQRYLNEIVRSFSTFLAQYNASQQDSDENKATAVGWFMG